MEKIYMENNNNNKNNSFFKSLMKSNTSVILSFTLAILGIASMVTYGFTQISYALPTIANLPDKITTDAFDRTNDTFQGYFRNASNDPIKGGVEIPLHKAHIEGGTSFPVYCIQRNVDFAPSVQYSKDPTIITDAGLIYLMANLYPTVALNPKTPIENAASNNAAQLETWLSQAAIWVYLSETQTDIATNDLTAAQCAGFRAATSIAKGDVLAENVYIGYDTAKKPLFDNYTSVTTGKTVNELITIAKAKKGQQATSLTVSKASNNISMTSDNKYYQSAQITIAGGINDTTIGQFNGYKIELTSAPDGTKIVDSDGKEFSSLDNITPGTKFFVRVPVDKVTEANKNLSINITGSFSTMVAGRYVYRDTVQNKDMQDIAYIKTINNNISKPLDIQLNYTPSVPNTGMTTAQTIYFIGLIVLLSGVGIIYANVKPAKEN